MRVWKKEKELFQLPWLIKVCEVLHGVGTHAADVEVLAWVLSTQGTAAIVHIFCNRIANLHACVVSDVVVVVVDWGV